jgi:hypothetical protein
MYYLVGTPNPFDFMISPINSDYHLSLVSFVFVVNPLSPRDQNERKTNMVPWSWGAEERLVSTGRENSKAIIQAWCTNKQSCHNTVWKHYPALFYSRDTPIALGLIEGDAYHHMSTIVTFFSEKKVEVSCRIHFFPQSIRMFHRFPFFVVDKTGCSVESPTINDKVRRVHHPSVFFRQSSIS